MIDRKALAAFAVAAACAAPAHANDVALAADGAWNPFAVDVLLADPAVGLGWIDDSGAALDFTFSVGAGLVGTLTVVDAVFAGDTFIVTNFGSTLGATSVVPPGTLEASANVGFNFDAALLDPNFSRGVYKLAPGSYRISGRLDQSVTFGGLPLDATAGALRLTVGPVPEPSTYALLLAGLGVMGLLARRHGRRHTR